MAEVESNKVCQTPAREEIRSSQEVAVASEHELGEGDVSPHCRSGDDLPVVTQQVTPHDETDGEAEISSKQVRFGSNGGILSEATSAPEESPLPTSLPDDSTTPSSKRGLVSRRGRYVSPGRRSVNATTLPIMSPGTTITASSSTVKEDDDDSPQNDDEVGAVLEYKTYRSPPRKREIEVPSLCNSSSDRISDNASSKSPSLASKHEEADSNHRNNIVPASSISCDTSLLETTSPLASNDPVAVDDSKKYDTGCADEKHSEESADEEAKSKQAMTPPPTARDKNKASNRTPPRGHFQTLPTLDDAKLTSPGGIFMANPPTPSRRSHEGDSDEIAPEEKKSADDELDIKQSPRRDREHYVATPTDFALDYGKGHMVSGSFDTSNVLAWLQSPTANGLFSPGGFGSIMNTPGVRTPRTPTVTTSFFFSDVASLPRGDNLTPLKGSSSEERKSRSQKGISNIICISPLASSRSRQTSATATPLNLKDVFASPKEKGNIRSFPMLNDTPSKDRPRVPQRSGSKDPNLDAVHLVERDLMEDEDLSVLLQLAANTPRSAGTAGGGQVFRSPNGRVDGQKKDENDLPALQLPVIGGLEGETSGTRLARKSQSRDLTDSSDFAPPQLEMRSTPSAKDSKEIYAGSSGKDKKGKSEAGETSEGNLKSTRKPAPYPHHPYQVHPGQDMSYYSHPMPPPGMPGPGGTMRVVVGGPPPSRNGKPASGSPSHSPPPPPHYSDYHTPYPPPHGMYSQYGPPHHMGYPYQGHYPPPPPRHMPIYGSHPPPPGTKEVLKKPKPGSSKPSKNAGIKRGSPLPESKNMGSNKKQKKPTPNVAPSSGSVATPTPTKKKNRPPSSEERGNRAKTSVSSNSGVSSYGGKGNDAAALAAAILRGVTMRPSGKWQAQLYFAGKSRYIGVFDTREKAALAYEIAREKLKNGPQDSTGKSTENLVNAARKAAFEGVNEKGK